MIPIITPILLSLISEVKRTQKGKDLHNRLPLFIQRLIKSLEDNFKNSNDKNRYQQDYNSFNHSTNNRHHYYNNSNQQYKNNYSQSYFQEPAFDPYKVLGVTKYSTAEQIKSAFNIKVKKYHPDRIPNASEKEKKISSKRFKEAVDAYDILKDPDKKRIFDTTGRF